MRKMIFNIIESVQKNDIFSSIYDILIMFEHKKYSHFRSVEYGQCN